MLQRLLRYSQTAFRSCKGAIYNMPTAKMMGAEVKRKEDPHLIVGGGNFVPNINIPGQLYAHFVRSPHAHARIIAIDSTFARNLDGVVTVFTGADLQHELGAMAWGKQLNGVRLESHPPLAISEVRHVGEAFAVVIARSASIAADAAVLINVDFEVLPATIGVLAALVPNAAIVHPSSPDNIEHRKSVKHGDPDKAFSNAFATISQRMVNQRLLGMPMETRGTIAQPDLISGGLTIWTSTQAPHWIRRDVAKMLSIPENSVRVVTPDVGGGFGVKIGLYPEDAVVALVSQKLCAPIKWIEDRSEHGLATTHGRAQVADVSAAVDARGVVTGLRMTIYGDIGAYPVASDIPDLTLLMGVGTYAVTDIEIAANCVYTNTTPVAAYRGAGRPEAAYYLERLMDLVARQLRIDPAEVRRRNYIPPSAFPYATPTGKVYDSGDYERNLDTALSLSNYAGLRVEQANRRSDGGRLLMGIGVASYVEMCGFGPFDSAQIRVEPSGTVTVTTGVSPHGQGGATTFAQIVADELGVDFDRIQVRHGDTGNTPMGNGTMGSRSIVVGGSSLLRASRHIRSKALKIAAHILEADATDVVFADGKYFVKGSPMKALSLAQIAEKAYSDELPDDIDPGLEYTDYFKPPELVYPFGNHIAVVDVDRETGSVFIREYFSVDDCGPRISPKLAAGQIHGGIAQGIGQALYEEAVYGDDGQLMTGTMMDYAMPKASYFPQFILAQTETRTPLNPLGVKGIGEAATIGSTPAIANAVLDALSPFGITHIDIPLKPERIWRAINSSQKDA